jgi:hypothetical protein
MGLDWGTWDPARPLEYPLPACKRCEPTEGGLPGCLRIAQLAARAVGPLVETAVAAERDECVKIAENQDQSLTSQGEVVLPGECWIAQVIAGAIRARGNP